jgi:Mrp family chromosome partitioning ATPase
VSSFASLERTLDRAIDSLATGESTREGRALLIEARRLRSVVANWRSIPPPPAVHDEMLDRVLQLSTAVGTDVAREEPADAGPHISVDPARAFRGNTDSYQLDFEPHLYSLESNTSAQRQAIPPPPAPPRAAPLTPPSGYQGIDFEPQAPRFDTQVNRRAVPEPPPTAPRAAGRNTVRPQASFDSPPPPAMPRARSAPPPAPTYESPPPPAMPRARSAPPPAPTYESPPPPAMPRARSAPPPAPAPPHESPPPRARSVPPPAVPAARPSSAPPPAPEQAPARVAESITELDELGVPRTLVTVEAVSLTDPVNPALVFLAEPYSARSDAYRTMRRKLLSSGNPRVIAVTSAHAGEGKTTFALNLALTLRESARGRVLLVEANHRAPSFHKMLGFLPSHCFLDQLSAHLDDPRLPWVAAEPLAKLHVMAIDPRIKRPPLLDPVAFGTGMDRLKQAGYDYIIVDAPPVLGSIDCNAISDSVDGMIFSSLLMKSKRKEMRKAVEQLEPAPIIGVVVLEV